MAARAAALILDAFLDYNERFSDITRRAQRWFERRNWNQAQIDLVWRMDLYDEVLVDIGYKSEGVIPANEFEDIGVVKNGDEIEVLIEKLEDKEGMVVLSKEKAEFKKKNGRDLAPPKTWEEFKQVAEFFQAREIDGKKVYGAYIFTERGSEGITMGVTNVLYPYGFKYDDPKKPYHMEGFVNSPGAVAGLEFYKALYKCCTAPGMTNAYMQ